MTKLTSLLLFAGLLLTATIHAAAPASPPAGGLRYTIAVTKFENRAKYLGPIPLADCWSAVLTDSLLQSGRFIVLGEADMRTAAMGEQDLAQSGRAAAGGRTPVTGVMTVAQLLVKGEITHFQDGTKSNGGNIGVAGLNLGLSGSTTEVNAVIYIVDASTGQVVASKKVTGKAKNKGVKLAFSKGLWDGDIGQFKSSNVGKAFEVAIDEAVAFCAAQIPKLRWSGELILVKDNQVFINRGQREGVAIGQVFKVGLTEILHDPGTGEVLDENFTQVGQIRAESVREKMSICSVVSGAGFEKGMNISPL